MAPGSSGTDWGGAPSQAAGRRVPPQRPHDQAGDEVAREAEADRRRDRHRVGSGQQQPRQRADDQPEEGEQDQVEDQAHDGSGSTAATKANEDRAKLMLARRQLTVRP